MYQLNEQKIKSLLNTNYIGKKFYYFDITTSTFDEAQRLPKENGAVICAKRQTNGRGRLGRSWQSEEGGIYFSVILRPEVNPENIQIMTSLCAVGIQKAISKYIPCKIKWPNDIVSENGRKICGILTKVYFENESNYYINVGIGINANTMVFDNELKFASSIRMVSGGIVDENKLLTLCLDNMEKSVDLSKSHATMAYYKAVSATIGKNVRVIYHNNNKEARGLCLDIKADGSLIIKKDTGELINVNSGEVSVRGIYGEEYV